LRALAEPAGVAVQTFDGAALGYRHRVRLAVRGRSRSPKVGLFRLGTHQVVDIPSCPIHHPLVNHVAQHAKRALRDTQVPPYSDARRLGTVRYLQVVVERATRTAQVVVVANTPSPDELMPLFDVIRDRLGDGLHSLFWNGNREAGNAILGADWACVCGPPWVVDGMGGVDVFYPPTAFGQSNPALAERLVAQVHDWVPPDAIVAEYYAGTGAIGLGLVARSREVRFNERSDGSIVGLRQGLLSLGGDAARRTQVSASAAGDAVHWLRDADVVIADPPRKGLDARLRAALAERAPDRFVYVSCNLDTFLADVEALARGGSLELRALTAWAMFPFTRHVETVALLRRRGAL
jgi:23S rRNA (uracil1939-C5)-methyltransferase